MVWIALGSFKLHFVQISVSWNLTAVTIDGQSPLPPPFPPFGKGGGQVASRTNVGKIYSQKCNKKVSRKILTKLFSKSATEKKKWVAKFSNIGEELSAYAYKIKKMQKTTLRCNNNFATPTLMWHFHHMFFCWITSEPLALSIVPP